MPNAVRTSYGTAGIVGVRGISLGAMTGPDNSSFGWHLQVNVVRENTEGTPSPPSLRIGEAGIWRFRWRLAAGGQTISCYAKQPANLSPYPSLVVRANPAIGINTDLTATSGGGTGWVKLGPITANASGPGVVWVELRNNLTGGYNPSNGNIVPWAPCFFDLIGT